MKRHVTMQTAVKPSQKPPTMFTTAIDTTTRYKVECHQSHRKPLMTTHHEIRSCRINDCPRLLTPGQVDCGRHQVILTRPQWRPAAVAALFACVFVAFGALVMAAETGRGWWALLTVTAAAVATCIAGNEEDDEPSRRAVR